MGFSVPSGCTCDSKAPMPTDEASLSRVCSELAL